MFPELTASIIASIVAIVMAFRGFGVWSLVWREMIATTLATVLVWSVFAPTGRGCVQPDRRPRAVSATASTSCRRRA